MTTKPVASLRPPKALDTSSSSRNLVQKYLHHKQDDSTVKPTKVIKHSNVLKSPMKFVAKSGDARLNPVVMPARRPKVHGKRRNDKHITKPKSGVKQSEHPLSLAFRETMNNYRSYLSESIPALLDKAQTTVNSSFTKAVDGSHDHLQRYLELVQPLTKPLSEELLTIIKNRGTSNEKKVHTKLGDRMTMFRRVLKQESETLANLQQKLQDTRQHVKTLVAGMECGKATKEPHNSPAEGYAAAVAKLQAEYRRKKAERFARFEADSKELVKKLAVAEQNHAQNAKLANQKFQRLLQATIDEQDDLAED